MSGATDLQLPLKTTPCFRDHGRAAFFNRPAGIVVVTFSPADLVSLHQYSHPCSYLPGREATMEFLVARQLRPATFQQLLDHGFRRSGRMFYRPRCAACTECRSLRVLVSEFQPNRSMRRNWRANQDLIVTQKRPQPTQEKYQLYRNYLNLRHETAETEGFEDFLYNSPVDTVELEFHLSDRLVAVAISDVVPQGVSTVYCYYDPAFERRGIGTFSILWQIEWCKRAGRPFCYLGYYIRECRKMNYKDRYHPHELFGEGGWQHGKGYEGGTAD